MKFTSININDLKFDRFTVDSDEINEELAGQIGVEFELGKADKNLPQTLSAFRFQTENPDMENPEITIWRGSEKISHFACAFSGPVSEISAFRVMKKTYHELKSERHDFVEERYIDSPGPSPCVMFLLFPGYKNLTQSDQEEHIGLIHSITLGIHFMWNCQ